MQIVTSSLISTRYTEKSYVNLLVSLVDFIVGIGFRVVVAAHHLIVDQLDLILAFFRFLNGDSLIVLLCDRGRGEGIAHVVEVLAEGSRHCGCFGQGALLVGPLVLLYRLLL